MNCEKIHKIMPDYLADALTRDEAEEVRRHLAACEACRREVEAHNKVWAMVGDLPELKPQPGFTASVRERLDKTAPKTRPLHKAPVRAILAVAASLLLMVGLYLAVGNNPKPPVLPDKPTVSNDLNLTAAEKAEIIRNLELLENYDSLASENLKTDDIDVLKKEEFLTVEELADRGVYPNLSGTAAASTSEADDR